MPNWKKVIVSGSDAILNKVTIPGNSGATTFTTNADTLIFSGSAYFTGSTVISGSLQATSITGSLLGTSSYADYALTASYALNGGGGGGGGSVFSYHQTASSATWSVSHNLNTYTPIIQVYDDSYNLISPSNISGSSLNSTQITFAYATTGYAVLTTGGNVSVSISGSNAILVQSTPATTWSFAHGLNEKYPVFTIFDSNDDVIVPVKIHADNVNTASIYFSTARTGTAVAANCGLSGSTFTSASYATTASYALTASFVTTAQTASYVLNTVSASFASTASFVTLAQTASFVTTAQTASYVQNAQTASYVLNAVSASYAATASYVSSNFQYEVHVSQVDGNDTTGDGSLLKPVASITKALTLVAGNRKTIIVHPGTYSESPSITVQYTTITGPGLIGGNIVISGTVSTNTGCTISGIKMTNLTITTPTATGNVNILNCEISGTLTKSSNADYTVLRLCDYNAASITGAGLIAIFGGNPNFTTVNNASANVILKSVVTVAPVLTAGTLSIVDSIVAAAVTNAFTSATGTVTTLSNSQFLTSALNNVAPIVLNGFYSIISCIFDKPNSTLVALSGTGGSTNSVDYFQYIDADNITAKGLTITGSVTATQGFTGSLFGTSSWAQNATTASYILNAVSSSFATTAQTASYVTLAQTASYIATASYALNSDLLDGLDSTSFVYTSSFNTFSSSYSTRITNVESTASAYVTTSGSLSTRVTNTENTASSLVTASGSFSTRVTNTESTSSAYVTTSGSFSTRIANTEATASAYVTTSGSLSTRVTTIESKYATTGSNTFSGNQTITTGYITLTQVSQSLNFADDTAAAAGGVPLGGLYRNGNFIAIRIV
jgi:hypothetical protein